MLPTRLKPLESINEKLSATLAIGVLFESRALAVINFE